MFLCVAAACLMQHYEKLTTVVKLGKRANFIAGLPHGSRKLYKWI